MIALASTNQDPALLSPCRPAPVAAKSAVMCGVGEAYQGEGRYQEASRFCVGRILRSLLSLLTADVVFVAGVVLAVACLVSTANPPCLQSLCRTMLDR